MVSFGHSLKQQREARGVSLQTIADATKVALRHLEAIEQDDAGNLSGNAFKRGFVQSYCRTIGLDDADWLRRYDAAHPRTEPDWAEFAEAVRRNRVRTPYRSRHRWGGVLAMLVAVTVMAWASWHFVVRDRLNGLPQSHPGTSAARALAASFQSMPLQVRKLTTGFTPPDNTRASR